LAYAQQRHEDACRALLSCPEWLQEDDWLDLIDAASRAAGPVQDQAYALLVDAVDDERCPPDTEALAAELLLGIPAQTRRDAAARALAGLIASGRAKEAARTYDALCDLFTNPRDRLDLLSVFDSVPLKSDTDGLFGRLADLSGYVRGGLDVDLLTDLQRQMRFVEDALDAGRDFSNDIGDQIARLRPQRPPHEPQPFAGLSLLVVGGWPDEVAKTVQHLKDLGAEDIKWIPAEKGVRVDARRIKDSLRNRTHALLLTHKTGHAQQSVLRPATQSLGIPLVLTGAGATRVERDLRRHLHNE
jgi:hypothetical protein